MAIEVFNRYENKYLMTDAVYQSFIKRLEEYMEPDAFNKENRTYTIANIYYDTPDHHLILNSLQKPSYKEKLRLRAYGVPDMQTEVYAEIKKKVRGLVNKRRSPMSLKAAYAFLEGRPFGLEEKMNHQVMNEIGYMQSRLELAPAMYLAYDRRAYFGIGEHDLRVSFDKNIRYRTHHIRLEKGAYGTLLLDEDTWLMEVKVSRSIPVWLTRLMAEYRIRPVSFSKYGCAYLSTRAQHTNERGFGYV